MTIDAQAPKDAATVFYFKHPDPSGREIQVISEDGSIDLFRTDELISESTAQTPADRFTAAISKRYRDAYTEAHAVVALGKIIKGIGGFLFIAGILAGSALASHSQNGERVVIGQGVIIGIVLGCLVGIPVFVLGVLVAAQGQTELATLDTAVNSSRHLSNEEVAAILTKRFSL